VTAQLPPDEPPAASAAASPAAVAGRVTPRLARWALALAVLAAIAAVVLWLDGRQRIVSVQEELARRLAASERSGQEMRARQARDEEARETLLSRLDRLEERIDEWQGQQLALEAMIQELAQGREDRLLAEVEQALGLAALQLEINGNVAAALIALEAADGRLAREGQTRLLALRKRLHEDIARLRALPLADLAGMALKLDGIIAQIDTLPLAFERRPPAVPDDLPQDRPTPMQLGFWASLASELWRELRQLIHIERLDRPAPALMAPEAAFFLRENLKLRLLAARLALLGRDGRAFREDIRLAHQWLKQHFDGEARAVQAALASLVTLAESELTLDLPDLRASFEALRAIKAGREMPPVGETPAASRRSPSSARP